MNNTQNLIIMAFLSFMVTTVVYPFVLRYALRHHVVDNPNARKIHRKPIPVMGGVVVYAGILAGCLAMALLVRGASIRWSLMALTTMLVLGVWDDVKNLSAVLRFFLQFCIVGAYIAFTGHSLGNFYGLFGIHEISPWLGIPLSLVAGVGIINAINMIDGIDGYSSGYGIMACSCFAALFIIANHSVWSSLAVIVASALIPFFMHNVFGVKSKMFIGDGGTLMLGTLMTVLVFCALTGETRSCRLETINVGMLAFTLAVLCIPVFDTLRVMTARIVRGNSPFHPDKTHLHHLFVDMGFSHLGAALFILMLNVGVVLIWFISWKMGASIDVQTYVVVALGVFVTFGFYKLMRCQQNGGPKDEDGFPQGTRLWHLMCRLGWHTHRENKRMWRTMRYLMDGPLYGGYKERIKRRLRKG